MAYDGSIKIDTKLDSGGLKKGLDKLGGVASKSVKGITTAIGAAGTALVAAGGFAIKAGIEFESAFAGVKKTVNATDVELDSLKQGIRNMSKEMPMAANEIAGIAENAGQLGIQTPNILGFTRVMADLGVATNLTGEEAAQTLAKFANITQMPQENFDRLGSTIVDLGNNLATTEADITAMALRLAGAGKQVGLSEAEILSFSGALSSVGIEADAGGTAFSKLMSDMQLSVETGNKNLSNFAQVAGMSSSEFKKAFQEDAASAMISFIQGLGNSEEKGISAIKVLDDMGIKEIRLRDALLRAAGAGDVFSDAIALGTKAWEENTALTDEAAQRYETLDSKISILKNGITDLGISFKESIDGPINEIVGSANDMITQLSDAFADGGFEGLVSALGDVLAQVISKITESLPQFIGLAISLVQSFATGIVNNLPQLSAAASEIMTSLFNGILQLLPGIMPIVAELGAKFVEGFIQYQALFYTAAIQIITALVQGIANNLPTLIPMAQNAIILIANTLIENLPTIINSAMEIILALALGLAQMLPELIPAIVDIVLTVANTLLSNLDTLIEVALALILALVDGIVKALPELIKAVPLIIGSIVATLITMLPDIIVAAIDIIFALIDGLIQALPELIAAVPNLIIAIITGIIENLDKIILAAPKIIIALITGLIRTIPQLVMAIPRIIMSIVDTFMSYDWMSIGKDIINGLINGIKGMVSKAITAAKEVAGSILGEIKGFFGIHSPSRVMRDEVGKPIVEGVAIGIKDNKGEVSKEFKKLLDELELQRDLDIINDEQYYKQLGQLRDKYLAKGTEDWWKYTKQIISYEKSLVEQQKKDIIQLYTDIATEAGKRIDEVLKLQDKMENKLKEYGNLYSKVSITKGHEKQEFLQLNNLQDDIDALNTYKNAIQAVRDRGASQEFMSILKDMSVEEGTEFANALLRANDTAFDTYLKQWQEKQETAAEISKELYKEETDETIKYWTDELEKAGLKVPEGFFDNGKSAAENFGEGFVSKIDEVMEKVKSAVAISMSNIMPTLSYAGGIPSISKVSTVYNSPTYQLIPSGETTSQQLETINNAEEINELRGRE